MRSGGRFVTGLLLLLAFWPRPPLLAQATARVLTAHFLDVGQGDGALIQSATGQTVLVDAGDSPGKIVAHLKRLGVSKLDLVIASHNHADHIGGLPEVIRKYRPRFYLDNGLPASTRIYRRVLEALRDAGTEVLNQASRTVSLGGGASLEVVPPPGIPGWGQNNNAVGLVLSQGSFRMSMAGDAEPMEWSWWIRNHRASLGRVQVHKASHHGSKYGDTAAALAMLRPAHVVISVGSRNSSGHPSRAALGLYQSVGSRVLRTDINGSITVQVTASGAYTISAQRVGDLRAELLGRSPDVVKIQ